MKRSDFERIVDDAISRLMFRFGYERRDFSISGRSYSASFAKEDGEVRISYEREDDVFQVYFFSRRAGVLSDPDDRRETPRLSDLNRTYLSGIDGSEKRACDAMLSSIHAGDAPERRLLAIAKELHLVMPRYAADRSTAS